MQRKRGRTKFGGEVLLVFEEEAAVGGIVQIPGAGGEFV